MQGMQLPPPRRAATSAGILLAVAVLLLAGDLAVLEATSAPADVLPFVVQTGNVTAVGMRITNAGGHDLVTGYEMFATAACGYTYRSPIFLRNATANTMANTTANATGNTTANATDDASAQPSTIDYTKSWVPGNVTFYVVESLLTPDIIRGIDVPAYVQKERFIAPPHLEPVEGDGTRIVRIEVNCYGDGRVDIQRGPHPGTSTRFAFSSDEPWLALMPVPQGIDFLYVVRAEGHDNETFALLGDNLLRGSQWWTYTMRHASVQDEQGILPDRVLRGGFVGTLAVACLLLGLALRRGTGSEPAPSAEAAYAVAAAGERHLLRLRQAWGVVGALLVPSLAAVTYLVWTAYTLPWGRWSWQTFLAVVVLDLAVLALWAVTFRRVHQDLVAWRDAWTRLDRTTLDDL